jgi:hypothetical protein
MEPRRGTRQKLKPRSIVTTPRQDGLQSTLTVHLDEVWVGVEDGPKWTLTRVSTWGINGHFGASSR